MDTICEAVDSAGSDLSSSLRSVGQSDGGDRHYATAHNAVPKGRLLMDVYIVITMLQLAILTPMRTPAPALPPRPKDQSVPLPLTLGHLLDLTMALAVVSHPPILQDHCANLQKVTDRRIKALSPNMMIWTTVLILSKFNDDTTFLNVLWVALMKRNKRKRTKMSVPMKMNGLILMRMRMETDFLRGRLILASQWIPLSQCHRTCKLPPSLSCSQNRFSPTRMLLIHSTILHQSIGPLVSHLFIPNRLFVSYTCWQSGCIHSFT